MFPCPRRSLPGQGSPWPQVQRQPPLGRPPPLRATTFNALGAMIPILIKQPEKPNDGDNPVRLVLSAACPVTVWETFEKRFHLKIWEFYGAVDGGGFAVFNLGNAPVGSIGPCRPAPDGWLTKI